MGDELFARVARWWDRDSLLSEKRALLALIGADVGLAETWWADLDGGLRWRLVSSMRELVRLAGELSVVIRG